MTVLLSHPGTLLDCGALHLEIESKRCQRSAQRFDYPQRSGSNLMQSLKTRGLTVRFSAVLLTPQPEYRMKSVPQVSEMTQVGEKN